MWFSACLSSSVFRDFVGCQGFCGPEVDEGRSDGFVFGNLSRRCPVV